MLHVGHAPSNCPVQDSNDQGKTWQDAETLTDGLDLTDRIKGCQQYFLKLSAGAVALKDAQLSWTTICQANVSTIPHLHAGQNKITYAASGQGLVAAGPMASQAQAHVVAGRFGSPNVTLELSAPRGAVPTHLYAAAWQASGAPPAPVQYGIDFSTDAGKSWMPVVKDWKVVRRPPEPADFWSQSFTWGDVPIADARGAVPVRVRFSNNGGKSFRKAEAHLTYRVTGASPTQVRFGWKDPSGQLQTASHTYAAEAAAPEDVSWHFDAGKTPQPIWVEIDSK